MNSLLHYIGDPLVIAGTLLLVRPVSLIVLLVVIFNIRKNKTRYFPIEKTDVYFVGSLFALMFVLATLLLSLSVGKTGFINALLGSHPAVNYGVDSGGPTALDRIPGAVSETLLGSRYAASR